MKVHQTDKILRKSLHNEAKRTNYRSDTVKKIKTYDLAKPDRHDDEISASSLGFNSPTDQKRFEEELDED